MLLENGRHAGAYYLAGYAIECALKACIARQTRKYDFPNKKTVNESYTHDLDRLIGAAGLRLALIKKRDNDEVFARYWQLILHWSEERRYDTEPQKSAEDFFQAIADPDHGVFQWLRERW